MKFEDVFLAQVNNTLNGIFKYYNSTVRRSELKFIADMFEKEVKKLGLMQKKNLLGSKWQRDFELY